MRRDESLRKISRLCRLSCRSGGFLSQLWCAAGGLWQHIVVVCRFCRSEVIPGKSPNSVPPRIPDDGRPRLTVGGRTYLVRGLLAKGRYSNVYLARWVVRLGETVCIKVARTDAGRDALRREQQSLRDLWKSDAQGAPYFLQQLPPPIDHGPVRIDGEEFWVSVLQWRPGFHTSLERAVERRDGRLDGRILVWVVKRALETLSFIHRSGYVHGALTPDHILLHPREHGAILTGFSSAQRITSSLKRPVSYPSDPRWRDLYPAVFLQGAAPTPADDIALLCRSILHAAGTSWINRSGSLPAALGRVLRDAADGTIADAWELREQVTAAAAAGYGAPKYSPLEPDTSDDGDKS